MRSTNRSKSVRRPGGVMTWMVGGLALAITGVASVATFVAPTGTLLPLEVTSGTLAAALVQTGLDPTSLAAAGVDANATTALVARAREHLNSNQGSFEAAQEGLRLAEAQVQALEHLAQTGAATREQASALPSAYGSRASAAATHASALSAFKAAATAGLTGQQRAALDQLWANRSWEVPAKYRLVDRTTEQWITLRDAVSHVRIAERRSETADPTLRQVVLDADANEAVAAAASSMTSNLAAVRAAWQQAVLQ
jgi:hypothetical protein